MSKSKRSIEEWTAEIEEELAEEYLLNRGDENGNQNQ